MRAALRSRARRFSCPEFCSFYSSRDVRFLLDTNALIPAEPTSSRDIEPTTSSIVTLLAALSQGGHQAVVHPSSLEELSGDRDKTRASMRRLLLRKYPVLEHPPATSPRLTAILGTPAPGSNSAVDLILLSAVEANAVDYFVTEDDGIHRRAKRIDLADRVVTIADALITVRALFPTVPATPPFVSSLVAHQLDASDRIFVSFRTDYPRFDDWLAKCKREHRQTWVIRVANEYAAICIVNHEVTNAYGFPGKALKVCSFKIADQYHGYRYGELLLKTLFSYAAENKYDCLFVEVFPKHEELFALLGDFGFEPVRESSKGERVLLKLLQSSNPSETLGPLEFNIKYGPHALTLAGASVFVVPIRPRYHDLLFPELRAQLALPSESYPFSNSIRKAYLSHSKIRKIGPGDAILFYRSEREQAVTAVGVVEGTLVSSSAVEVARFVGQRTVYSYAEISEMTAQPILAVLFRLSRILKTNWNLDLLTRVGIIKRAPQSFMQVKPEAVSWIARQLNVPR